MTTKTIPLGFFGAPQNIDDLTEAGYTEIEMHLSDIQTMSETVFQDTRKRLMSGEISCKVANNPIPMKQSISSPDYSPEKDRSRVERIAFRSAGLGISMWNFGNAYARSVTAGMDSSCEKVKETFCMVADVCREYGLILLLEPIGPDITNLWLSLPEVVGFLKELNMPHLKSMVDLRWHVNAGRPAVELYEYADWIAHAHIDNPMTNYKLERRRVIPRLTDGYDYTAFLEFIKSSSYNGSLSVEALTIENYRREAAETVDFFAHFGIIPEKRTGGRSYETSR